jgi:alpha-N-arabinofuranosidase
LHELPRTQYGHFIEHLGKCIKGGVWAEGEAPDMFLGGGRLELVGAIRSIHPALIRYPGGCFADGYPWKDGIGPRQSRPRRTRLPAWC